MQQLVILFTCYLWDLLSFHNTTIKKGWPVTQMLFRWSVLLISMKAFEKLILFSGLFLTHFNVTFFSSATVCWTDIFQYLHVVQKPSSDLPHPVPEWKMVWFVSVSWTCWGGEILKNHLLGLIMILCDRLQWYLCWYLYKWRKLRSKSLFSRSFKKLVTTKLKPRQLA